VPETSAITTRPSHFGRVSQEVDRWKGKDLPYRRQNCLCEFVVNLCTIKLIYFKFCSRGKRLFLDETYSREPDLSPNASPHSSLSVSLGIAYIAQGVLEGALGCLCHLSTTVSTVVRTLLRVTQLCTPDQGSQAIYAPSA
jgi:hypothetical protein